MTKPKVKAPRAVGKRSGKAAAVVAAPAAPPAPAVEKRLEANCTVCGAPCAAKCYGVLGAAGIIHYCVEHAPAAVIVGSETCVETGNRFRPAGVPLPEIRNELPPHYVAAIAAAAAASKPAAKPARGEARNEAIAEGDAPRVERSSRPRHNKLLEYSVCAALRWMGVEGWTKEEARKCLDAFKLRPSDCAVSMNIKDGATGTFRYGPAAVVSAEHAAELDKAAGRGKAVKPKRGKK